MKEKRGILLLSLLIIIPLIKVVSALPTITEFFNAIDEEELVLILLGAIIFIIANFSLKKAFGPEGKTPAGIIAGALAIGGAYFSLKYNYTQAIGDFISGLGFNIGIGSDSLYTVLFFVVIGVLILLAILTSISWAMIILGVFMILLSSYAYESDLVTVIGVGLIILAFIIGWLRHRYQNTMYMHRAGGWLGGRVTRPGIFGGLKGTITSREMK